MKNSAKPSITKPRVLVVGRDGQLGHDLMRALSPAFVALGVDHAGLDITDRKATEKKVEEVKPDIVLNAAAYNKVEEAGRDPSRAYLVNALGPYHLAVAARAIGVPVLHVSTDYVFPGTKKSGYKEGDETHPLNVYGASKEAGERLVRIGNPDHWIVRTSALFGIHAGGGKGYNFVTKMLSLAKEGGEVRVVADQFTAPTYTRDLADGIRELLAKEVPCGTYHLVNEGSATWHDFAREIFRRSGLRTKLTKTTTADSGTTIDRPKRSILKNKKLKALGIGLPPWEDALGRYLTELHR
ncbi:MAG: dTDP-4-dehydrorhamnose reductase [Candidatus Lloydbacteria bacterium RIFCSPHIGHO2_01_FULL_54_11]|nr:MAG: dTDP-4-dehydrorhamnose reductase [Candidatus Lloydbacteria bacterium RIFCSPHIGHO2_01_FULL_54_11]